MPRTQAVFTAIIRSLRQFSRCHWTSSGIGISTPIGKLTFLFYTSCGGVARAQPLGRNGVHVAKPLQRVSTFVFFWGGCRHTLRHNKFFRRQTRQIFNSVRVKKGVCNGCEPTSKMKARDEPAHSADTTQTSAVSSGSSIYLSQHTAAQQVLSTGADETPSSSCSSDSHRQSSAKPTCDDRITHLQSTTSNAELGELPQPPLASSQRVPELFTAQPGTRRTYSTGSLSEQCGSSPKSTVGVMNFLIPPATVSGVIGKGGGTVKEIVRSSVLF